MEKFVRIFFKIQLFWMIDAQMFAAPNVFVDDVCYCVTAGKCINNKTNNREVAINKRPDIEASDGSLQSRISRFSNESSSVDTVIDPFVMPIMTGLKIDVKNQSKCDEGLELCCPTTGYGCGIRYPSVSYAPKPNESGQCEYGAYPWQVAILTESDEYVGSGVLIDHRHVLTVAHKVYKSTNIKCRLGEWSIVSNFEPLPIQEIQVDDNDIILHPNFTNLRTLKNDIAILRLNYPGVQLGIYPTISPVCMPNQQLNDLRCWVAGWGSKNFSSPESPKIMIDVDLPLVNNSNCQERLRQTRLGSKFILDEYSFICAGGEAGKDACTGDGGSPLACSVNGRFYLVGLVAWGVGCGLASIPGVYVNVQSFIPWIQQTIREKEENEQNMYTTTKKINVRKIKTNSVE